MLLHYSPIAERLGYLLTSIPKSPATRGMSIIQKTFHIKLCESVALRQNDPRRFYLREQPVGTGVDNITMDNIGHMRGHLQ
eukprot:8253804-Pyramimonas_sp.AAC.1